MIVSLTPPLVTAPAPRSAVVRIAAIGDLHLKADGSALLASIPDLRASADLLLVAGDMTDNGRIVEAEAAAEMLAAARIPTFAVLGNHDLRTLRRTALRRAFDRAGIGLIDGGAEYFTTATGVRVGIAATTGSGGGFWPVEGPDAIHARTLKRLAVRSRRESLALDQALAALDADYRVALMHFSPTVSTLGREPLAKYWMLGNCELGKVLDEHRPDLVIHGHAHLGNLIGQTLSGVEVRNVAASITHGVHVETLGAEAVGLPVIAHRARRA